MPTVCLGGELFERIIDEDFEPDGAECTGT